MANERYLDFIVIPTGGGEFDAETGMYSQDRDRTKEALESGDRLSEKGRFVISGYKGEGRDEMRRGQSYSIYKCLRSHGIRPLQMVVEGKSHDTLENVVFSLRKVKSIWDRGQDYSESTKPIRIAFVSYGGHLRRVEDFAVIAKRKKAVEGDFEVDKIMVLPRSREQEIGEQAYERNLLRRLNHQLKLVTM